MKRRVVILGLCLFALLSIGFVLLAAKRQQKKVTTAPVEAAKATDATGKTVAVARVFLATLDDSARAKLIFPFNSDQKRRWSNFPIGIYPRNGLRMGDLNAAQREAVINLLGTALSKRGLQKVKEIMEGDEVLKHSGDGPGGGPPDLASGSAKPDIPPVGAGSGIDPGFGRDNYYLALLGEPSLNEPWMIQFGGHHLAINVTIVGKSNVLTPSLPAAQPAIYKLNSETVRPLGRENDKGFALINSLEAYYLQPSYSADFA